METHATSIGDNANFSNASALAFGAHSTATHNSYQFSFRGQAFTEQQVKYIIKSSQDIQSNIEQHTLNQEIKNLPRAEAAHDDYQSQKKSGMCFENTREALLEELASWVIDPESPQIIALSGPAGIGKSTIAYTFAARAVKPGILGASFFFSRDELDRRNAKKLFTTIAYQLCIHDKEFAHAIGEALIKERGTAAVTKNLEEQMQSLILEPLRDISKSRNQPTVIVIDAIDECDAPDCYAVLDTLEQLVNGLASFKVLITARPQSRLDHLLSSQKVFFLQNIKDETVNRDIRRYLKYSLSREEVHKSLPGLREKWSAVDEDIEHLVKMAGGLFIIASTAIRFILDVTFYNPAGQMAKLKTDSRATLVSLETFYTIILRAAVPEKCVPELTQRFRVVIGTILFVQRPLPIEVLKHLTKLQASDIDGVLNNLKSVIVVENDTPRIYHQSFFDFLTNDQHAPLDLLIVPKGQHTQITINCFQIMNAGLRQNILNLEKHACFTDNEVTRKEKGISDHENIPLQLRYACIYWINHVQGANIDDDTFNLELKQFAQEHLLHWLEALSLISQLFLAINALRTVIPLLGSRSPDTSQLFSDCLRFISMFYEIIETSALHLYYSALPLAPTESLLYRTYYKKETTHNICRVEGGPKHWDTILSRFDHGRWVERVAFSQDSSKLVSWSGHARNVRLWDAFAGIPLATIWGDMVAIANTFAVTAEERTMTIYNLDSFKPVTTLETAAPMIQLTVSADGSRIATGLSNGVVNLWDGKMRELINTIDCYKPHRLALSPTGSRLALNSYHNKIKFRDGWGERIAELDYQSQELKELVFSQNGGTHAGLAGTEYDQHTLTVWDQNGKVIGVARGVQEDALAISADGSLLATGAGRGVQLWTTADSSDTLLQPLESFGDWGGITSLMFSQNDVLAIGSFHADIIILYNAKSQSIITTLPYEGTVTSAGLSPDCSRLAAGGRDGSLVLWDVQNMVASSIQGVSEEFMRKTHAVSALAFSPDGSQLCSGLENGIVAMWEIECASQPIASYQGHSSSVSSLAFSPDGKQVASGSDDGTVRLWDGSDDTSAHDALYVGSGVSSIAFSSEALATACYHENITLWDLGTFNIVGTLDDKKSRLVKFSHRGDLLASFNWSGHYVAVWDTENRTIVAKFMISKWIDALLFLPDDSCVAAKLSTGDVKIFHIRDGTAGDLRRMDLVSLFQITHWNSIPVSVSRDEDRFMVVQNIFLYAKSDSGPTMFWVPRYLAVDQVVHGPTAIVLGCKDGSIIFLQCTHTDPSKYSGRINNRKKALEGSITDRSSAEVVRWAVTERGHSDSKTRDVRREVREGAREGTSGRSRTGGNWTKILLISSAIAIMIAIGAAHILRDSGEWHSSKLFAFASY